VHRLTHELTGDVGDIRKVWAVVVVDVLLLGVCQRDVQTIENGFRLCEVSSFLVDDLDEPLFAGLSVGITAVLKALVRTSTRGSGRGRGLTLIGVTGRLRLGRPFNLESRVAMVTPLRRLAVVRRPSVLTHRRMPLWNRNLVVVLQLLNFINRSLHHRARGREMALRHSACSLALSPSRRAQMGENCKAR
jgi:hypothetical protein